MLFDTKDGDEVVELTVGSTHPHVEITVVVLIGHGWFGE
jgi:hypothetical protein